MRWSVYLPLFPLALSSSLSELSVVWKPINLDCNHRSMAYISMLSGTEFGLCDRVTYFASGSDNDDVLINRTVANPDTLLRLPARHYYQEITIDDISLFFVFVGPTARDPMSLNTWLRNVARLPQYRRAHWRLVVARDPTKLPDSILTQLDVVISQGSPMPHWLSVSPGQSDATHAFLKFDVKYMTAVIWSGNERIISADRMERTPSSRRLPLIVSVDPGLSSCDGFDTISVLPSLKYVNTVRVMSKMGLTVCVVYFDSVLGQFNKVLQWLDGVLSLTSCKAADWAIAVPFGQLENDAMTLLKFREIDLVIVSNVSVGSPGTELEFAL